MSYGGNKQARDVVVLKRCSSEADREDLRYARGVAQ